MRNKILSAALAFVTLVGLVPLTATTAEASEDDEIVEITVLGTCNYDYANEVVELVNEERAAAGLNTLVNDKRLTEWAMQRAAEQAFYFGHVRPDGTGWSDVLDREEFGYPNYLYTGENAAMGHTSPTQVMNGWMNSAGHKATLMDESYTAVGVGCVRIGGYTYWIQIFAGPCRAGGADYKIIESTYSGTKEQTFTISTYTSNLRYISVSHWNWNGSLVIGTQATYCLSVKGGGMSKAPGYAYVVPIDVSDVKDESTGKVIATTSVAADGAVTITATAAGTGYLYLYPYEGASPQIAEIVVLSGYTVTFDSDGGSSVSPQTVAYNSAATEPTAPTKKGYVFDGWYAIVDQYDEKQDDWNQICVTYDFSTTVTADITLYASWKADTTSTTTTAATETTTAAPETTTAKSEETTAASTESDETTAAQDSDSEPSSELQDSGSETSSEPQDSNSEPDEETTGTPDESETTEEPDEETTDDATETTETETETGTTAEDVTETTETGTATEGKTETDGAVVVNNGDNADSGDKENGSHTWIIVLVVVLLLLAAATVTVIIVLKKEKNDEDTSPSDGDGENDSTEE